MPQGPLTKPEKEKLINQCLELYPKLDRTLVEIAIDFHYQQERLRGKNYDGEKVVRDLEKSYEKRKKEEMKSKGVEIQELTQ